MNVAFEESPVTDTSSTPSAFGSPVEGNAVTLIVVAPVAAPVDITGVTLIVVAPVAAPVTARRSDAEFAPESDAVILSVALFAV